MKFATVLIRVKDILTEGFMYLYLINVFTSCIKLYSHTQLTH